MKTSYIYLALSIILIAGTVSLGSQNINMDENESYAQYELRLSSEVKIPAQVISSESEIDTFIEDKLDFEIWMTEPCEWNCID